MAGTLYLISTPIGNLEDITLRALRVLKEADLIACEDTRQTRKLLDHFQIAKPVVSCHEHNEAARAAELVARLRSGANVALVTDAGTPLVSDPGYRVTAAAIEAGVPVVPVPGASAALAALAAAGLATDQFRFCGFLPPKTAGRRKRLEELRGENCTLIFYEAPHRILDALADVASVMGSRCVVVARELTKMHEEFLRGSAAEIRSAFAGRPAVKGEITLLIAGSGGAAEAPDSPAEDAVRELEARGVSRMDAIKQVAKARGLGKREVYRRISGSGRR